MEDDLELLGRWRRGGADSPEAADELFQRLSPSLQRFFANRVRDEDEREDLVQDTWRAFLESVMRSTQISSLHGFISGIARNKFYQHLRVRYRRIEPLDSRVDSLEDDSLEDDTSPENDSFEDAASLEDDVSMLEQSQLLHAAMAKLSVKDKVVLEMSYWHDLSSLEIATILSTTPATVRSRLLRARKEVRRKLEENADQDRPGEAPERDLLLGRLRELDSTHLPLRYEVAGDDGSWAADSGTVSYSGDDPEHAELLEAMQAFIRAEVSEPEPFECIVVETADDFERILALDAFVGSELAVRESWHEQAINEAEPPEAEST